MNSDKNENELSITAKDMASLPDMPDAPVMDQPLEVKPAVSARKVRSVPTGRRGRVPCLGGCGTMVIPSLGECRKCRKARLRAGAKHVAKAG